MINLTKNFCGIYLCRMADQDDVYFKPWCRGGPYVVGIVTGYLLYITEKNKPKIPKVKYNCHDQVADSETGWEGQEA